MAVILLLFGTACTEVQESPDVTASYSGGIGSVSIAAKVAAEKYSEELIENNNPENIRAVLDEIRNSHEAAEASWIARETFVGIIGRKGGSGEQLNRYATLIRSLAGELCKRGDVGTLRGVVHSCKAMVNAPEFWDGLMECDGNPKVREFLDEMSEENYRLLKYEADLCERILRESVVLDKSGVDVELFQEMARRREVSARSCLERFRSTKRCILSRDHKPMKMCGEMRNELLDSLFNAPSNPGARVP